MPGYGAFGVPQILPRLPFILVYLAGLVSAIILTMRTRSTPAILALVGFGVLFVMSLASFGQGPLVGALARPAGGRGAVTASTGVGCCCSAVDVLAIVCLIVALWQAVSAAGRPGKSAQSEPGAVIGQEAPTLGTGQE